MVFHGKELTAEDKINDGFCFTRRARAVDAGTKQPEPLVAFYLLSGVFKVPDGCQSFIVLQIFAANEK